MRASVGAMCIVKKNNADKEIENLQLFSFFATEPRFDDAKSALKIDGALWRDVELLSNPTEVPIYDSVCAAPSLRALGTVALPAFIDIVLRPSKVSVRPPALRVAERIEMPRRQPGTKTGFQCDFIG